VITHNQEMAERLPRRIEVLDGHIVADVSGGQTALASSEGPRS